jgi:hypothetical protein
MLDGRSTTEVAVAGPSGCSIDDSGGVARTTSTRPFGGNAFDNVNAIRVRDIRGDPDFHGATNQFACAGRDLRDVVIRNDGSFIATRTPIRVQIDTKAFVTQILRVPSGRSCPSMRRPSRGTCPACRSPAPFSPARSPSVTDCGATAPSERTRGGDPRDRVTRRDRASRVLHGNYIKGGDQGIDS